MNTSMFPSQRPSLLPTLTALAAFFLLAWLSVRLDSVSERPSPVASDGFSMETMMALIRRIASEPHPIGTQANAAVRAYLVAELEALGLETHVQRDPGTFISANGSVVGVPHNVLARLPGLEDGKALMLSAHYDSVVNGFGAADNGASVAAILETIRVLKSSGPLRNDLIVLLTDGEEAGMLGADAFITTHPWAKQVGVVLNFEFRGNDGPVFMFETSAGNGKLIDGYATVPRPIASSLMYEIYRLMPNDTDMSVFKKAGIPGMNFAAVRGMTSYHTRLDRPERINVATLQHQAETMLATARYFGNADLGALESKDVVYFNVPGAGLVTYSAQWVPWLSIGVALLFAFTFWRGVNSGSLRIGRTLLAMPAMFLIALLLAAACLLLWLGVCAIHPGYGALSEVYDSQWYWLSFTALAIGAFALLAAWIRKQIDPMELTMGAILAWLLGLLMSTAWAPGISFLLVFSIVPVLLALAIFPQALMPAARDSRGLIWIFAAAAPSIFLFTPVLHNLLHAATTHASAVVVFVEVLLLGVLTPVIVGMARPRLVSGISFAAGFALLLSGVLTTRFDDVNPLPNNLIYVQNGSPGKALWLSPAETLDAWTEAVLGPAAVHRNLIEAYGPEARQYWVASAPDLGVRPPAVELLRDTVSGDTRVIDIRVRSLRNSPEIRLFPEGADLRGVTVQGRPVGGETKERWALILYAPPESGVEISMRVTPGQAFALRAIDRSYGLPEGGLPPREPWMMIDADGAGDTMQAVTVVSFEETPS